MNVSFYPIDRDRDAHGMFKHLPYILEAQAKGIIAVDNDTGKPIAFAIFDRWTASSATGHWWIGDPLVLRHGFFEECADYLFNTCKLKQLMGYIAENNTESFKLAKSIGMTELFRIKDGFDEDVDMIVLSLHVDDAGRWLTNQKEAA